MTLLKNRMMRRMNISRLVLTMVMSAMSVLAGAQPRSAASAEAIARQFASEKAIAGKTPRMVMVKEEQVNQLSRSATRGETVDEASFFVFNDEANGSFVIVSGDERQEEVLGYSVEGLFQSEEIPCGLRTFLTQYNREFEHLQSQDSSDTLAEDGELMTEGSDMTASTRGSTRAVSPLIKTSWGQRDCYYNYCPIDPKTKDRCLTGCVATAMSQVMNYHKHPSTGKGSNAYTTKNRKIDQSMNFSKVSFDWSNMKNSYSSSSSSASVKAVSTLMHACGVSAFMEYTSTGSGASYSNATYALIHNFKYNPNTRMYMRNYYTSEDWEQIIQTELDAGRPILYCGFDDPESGGGGHAFVLDGIDSSGRYHFNWGWNGSYDGYFKLTSLKPGSANYTYYQEMIAQITSKEVGSHADPWYAAKFEFNSSTREITIKDVYNYCSDANIYSAGFNGHIGWLLKNISTGKVNYDTYEVSDLKARYGYTKLTKTIPANAFAEGASYYLYPVVLNKAKSLYTRIRTAGSKTDYYLVKVKNGKLEVTCKGDPNDTKPKMSFVSVSSDNQNLTNLTKNDVLVLRAKLKNTGKTASVNTRLRIWDQNMNGKAASATVVKTFSKNSETTVVIEYSLKDLALGKYKATIQYQETWGDNNWKYVSSMVIDLTVKQEAATTPKMRFVSSSAENENLENLTSSDKIIVRTTFLNTGKTGDVNTRFKIWDDNMGEVFVSKTYTFQFVKDKETTIRTEHALTDIPPGKYFALIQYQKSWDDNKWYYNKDMLISFSVKATKPDIHFVSVSCENSKPNSLTQDDKLVLSAEFTNNGLTQSTGTRVRLFNEKMEGVAYSESVTRKFQSGTETSFRMEFSLKNIPEGTYKATIQYLDSWSQNAWIYNPDCLIDIKVARGTAIIGVENDEDKNAPVFDLNGRRLDKPRKGINIVGGKKVLVK